MVPAMSARSHAIERWDDYIHDWLTRPSPPPLSPLLAEWFDSYRGSVTEKAMPEPYGGQWDAPRMVILGINPGEADLTFQGRDGIFAGQIAELGSYSAWAATDPYRLPPWESRHGINVYGRAQLNFVRRWTEDEELSAADLLTVEMYPWHSKNVTAAMRPPAAVLQEFVWAPLAEVDSPLFFAFGAGWTLMCEQLGLKPESRWGPGGKDLGSKVKSRSVVTYRLSTGQRVVVCWQQGYAGPPGTEDVQRLRVVLGD
jgi:hypothetical protein